MIDERAKKVLIIAASTLGIIVLASLVISGVKSAKYRNDFNKSFEESIQKAEEHEKIKEIKNIAAITFSDNLYDKATYDKRSPLEVEKLVNKVLVSKYGEQYTVTVTEDYRMEYNFEQKKTELSNDKNIDKDNNQNLTEEGKIKAKIIAQNVHAKNLYKEVNGTYEKATAGELQKLINEELKNELGEQYFVVVTEDLEIKYNFE